MLRIVGTFHDCLCTMHSCLSLCCSYIGLPSNRWFVLMETQSIIFHLDKHIYRGTKAAGGSDYQLTTLIGRPDCLGQAKDAPRFFLEILSAC